MVPEMWNGIVGLWPPLAGLSDDSAHGHVVWNWMENRTCQTTSWFIKLADTCEGVHTTWSLPACGSISRKTEILSGQYCHLTLILWTQCTNVERRSCLWEMLMTFTFENFLDCRASWFLIDSHRLTDMVSAKICRSQGNPRMRVRYLPPSTVFSLLPSLPLSLLSLLSFHRIRKLYEPWWSESLHKSDET